MKKNKWEEFAKESAEEYILTGSAEKSDKKSFFQSGEEFTKKTLQGLLPLLPGKKRALEIGSGIGRLTLPHAEIFEEIIAVDISPTMLKKLDRNADQLGKKIYTYLPSQKWDVYTFDYAYSYLVFQHIEHLNIIKNYIKGISRTLKVGGIAQLQFDTRPQNIFYKIRNKLPDYLLPKFYRKSIRRIRRDSNTLRKNFEKNNLQIIQEKLPNTVSHLFILKKV